MKPQTRLLIFSALLLTGCIGPKVNTCIYDGNVIDQAIRNSAETLSRDEVLALVHQAKPWYCVPPGASDNSKDFHLALQTGQHGYSSEDWGVLMHWISDHTK